MNPKEMQSELERLTNILAKGLAEGCIFINPFVSDAFKKKYPSEPPKSKIINSQSVHLCSDKINPGFNDGQRITVKIIKTNIESTESNSVYHTPDVYCYDTSYSSLDFSLVGNNYGIELSDLIDRAEVTVRYDDCLDIISIECTDISHRLRPHDLLFVCKNDDMYKKSYDYRSAISAKYCVHKDIHIDANIYLEIKMLNDQDFNDNFYRIPHKPGAWEFL